MWEGRSALSELEGVVSPAHTVCMPEEETDGLFFSYYFKTPRLIEQFARYSQGLGKDTLNLKFEAFSRISVATPRFPEQQRIAECLSTRDELIRSERQKRDALSHRKHRARPFVAQVAQPAVSPTASRRGVNPCRIRRLGNPRHSRLGSLRYGGSAKLRPFEGGASRS